jgi:RHS repeat-associated protein
VRGPSCLRRCGGHCSNGGPFSATFDEQDRILTYGDYSFGWTPNGELQEKENLAKGETTTYTYDALGNLLAVELPSGADIEYLVDALGRRVGKKVNGVVQNRWIWRSQLQLAAEVDSSGNVITRYVYADGGTVPDLMVSGTRSYRLIKDHLGSVRLVLRATDGAVMQRIDYDSWGRVTLDTNPGFQPFGFAGGLYDQLTGLVRFGARDYDPEIGRWTAKDPLRFAQADGPNLYLYVHGDPINFRDPFGLYGDDGGAQGGPGWFSEPEPDAGGSGLTCELPPDKCGGGGPLGAFLRRFFAGFGLSGCGGPPPEPDPENCEGRYQTCLNKTAGDSEGCCKEEKANCRKYKPDAGMGYSFSRCYR